MPAVTTNATADPTAALLINATWWRGWGCRYPYRDSFIVVVIIIIANFSFKKRETFLLFTTLSISRKTDDTAAVAVCFEMTANFAELVQQIKIFFAGQ